MRTTTSGRLSSAAIAASAIAACGAPDAAPAAKPTDPAVLSPARLARGLPMHPRMWSPDGRFAVFEVVPRDGEPWTHLPIDVIVDTTTFASFELERVTQLVFAPDQRHLAAAVDHHVVVYDLATSQPVGASSPIANQMKLVGDGRLAWVERDGAAYRVHLRDLATGAETMLLGLPQPMSLSNPVEHDRVELLADSRGRVVAWTANAVRLWESGSADPIVSLDGYYEMPPLLFDDALAVVRGLYSQGAMQFVDLSTPGHHDPTELQHGGSCGGGEVQRNTRVDRCGPGRYLVRGRDHMCVWDVVRGKVTAAIDDMRDDYRCTGDVVRIGDGEPYAYYSAQTGKRLRHHVDELVAAPGLTALPPPPTTPRIPIDATDAKPSPTGALVAGMLGDRGAVWTHDGRELWKSPAPSEAAGIVLARGQLAVVGRSGEVWHLDLAKRALTTGVLASCTLPEAPVLAADGRLAAACADNRRAIMIEGSAKPLYRGVDAGWHVSGATNASSAAISYVTSGAARAWAPPDPAQVWSYDVEVAPEALAISADHSLYATVMNAGRGAHLLLIRDAANRARAVTGLADVPVSMQLSADNAYLAVAQATHYGTKIDVIDTKLGTRVDTLYAATAALAWSPDGARFAYWPMGNFGLAIREVATKRDVDVRLVAPAPQGPIRQIAWGEGNVLAVLADEVIWLWDDAPAPSTILLGGSGGVEIRANTTARLLGDAAAARSLYSCRSGDRTTPETWCDDKLVDR